MDRKEFIKRLLIGGAGLSLLPGILVGRGNAGRVTEVDLDPVQDHVRHGQFAPIEQAVLSTGPEWLTHFRQDRFHANGIHAQDGDMLHLTLGLGGSPLGITLAGDKAFVGNENGWPGVVQLPAKGAQRLFKSRSYEAWLVAGDGKADLDVGVVREAFLTPLQGTAWLQGYKAQQNKGLWARGAYSPEVKQAKNARSILLLKFA